MKKINFKKQSMTQFGLISGLLYLSMAQASACIDANFELRDYLVTGNAYAQGELVYTETLRYESNAQGGILTTRYVSAKAQEIANKKVEFNCRLSAPDFTIEDNIENITEGASHQQNEIVTFRGNDKQRIAKPDGDYVIDAGFDHFVRQNWQPLMAGKRLSADYLFAREGEFITLRFEKANAPENLSNRDLDNVVFFKVGANNFLFRLLSSPIYVGYDATTQQLRYYTGPSNVPAMREYKSIVIEYEYTPIDTSGAG